MLCMDATQGWYMDQRIKDRSPVPQKPAGLCLPLEKAKWSSIIPFYVYWFTSISTNPLHLWSPPQKFMTFEMFMNDKHYSFNQFVTGSGSGSGFWTKIASLNCYSSRSKVGTWNIGWEPVACVLSFLVRTLLYVQYVLRLSFGKDLPRPCERVREQLKWRKRKRAREAREEGNEGRQARPGKAVRPSQVSEKGRPTVEFDSPGGHYFEARDRERTWLQTSRVSLVRETLSDGNCSFWISE